MTGYLARRVGLCSALALVLGFAVPRAAADATANWWPPFVVLGVSVAFLPSVILMCVAVPALWDALLRRTGVARYTRRHLSRADNPRRNELSYAERLRRPLIWAEGAGVSGTRRVTVTTHNQDGSTSQRDKKVPTFPRCARVFMGVHGPTGTYVVPPGTTPHQWEAERIAAQLGKASVRVEKTDARTVSVTVLTRDGLSDKELVPFRMVNLADPADPICIGVSANGVFALPVFGRHTLLLGASNSGKSSVIWSVVGQLAPSIHAGIVRLHGIDLKGGVELASGRDLFHNAAYTYDDAAEIISNLAERLDERLARMRERGLRKHEPTVAEPLEILLIDEAASLTYVAPDRKTAEVVNANLKRILSTARAAGIAVLAAMQDPRKEAFPVRDLFTQTIALRFRTKDDSVLALGSAAYEAGAHCERIPQTQAGTGYSIDGDTGKIVQFRAFWVSDETIRELARRYPGRKGEGQL
ncbi:FtsK/SpoIIIE domain-containing protein [Paramicrobacterium agarici]|uniref:S-DNA-T family DNA segregation ATPase FtsK/SpoIIIE n=1 Tax=Paramicrobacterium agarici TaxID=630514 RepID=A0A2A9DTP3_9MICO|nr:FtsK/SpoIIIE domain-containing protein [Microbacterium agarici]PFG29290.1 S-DNA-T family DNA segregation ATPase FtsK/SpoIIIE [Microbacterium agarici]